MSPSLTLAISLLAAALAALNVMQIYILSDLRDRVKRMEDRFIDRKWTGDDRRRPPAAA